MITPIIYEQVGIRPVQIIRMFINFLILPIMIRHKGIYVDNNSQ